MKKPLTQTGYEIWQELNGYPVTPIRPQRTPHQVIARGGSLMGNVEAPVVLWLWAVRHAERLIEELDYLNVLAGKLAALVRYKDGDSTGGEARPVRRPPDSTPSSTRRGWPGPGVPPEAGDAPAFGRHRVAPRQGRAPHPLRPARPKRNPAAMAKRAINARFGRFKVRSGSTLYLPAVYADPANDFDVCDVCGKICF